MQVPDSKSIPPAVGVNRRQNDERNDRYQQNNIKKSGHYEIALHGRFHRRFQPSKYSSTDPAIRHEAQQSQYCEFKSEKTSSGWSRKRQPTEKKERRNSDAESCRENNRGRAHRTAIER